MALGFVGVTCEDTLIEALDWRERRPIAEHNIQEFKAIHVPSEHDKTQSEWRREH